MDYYDYELNDVFDDPAMPFATSDAIPFDDIYHNCIIPSFQQFYGYVEEMLFYSFLFRILTNLAHRIGFSHAVPHLVSIVCGNLTLISIIGSSVFYSIAFIYAIYFVLAVTMTSLQLRPKEPGSQKIVGYTMAVICLAVLIGCELFQWNVTIWARIRGVQMIATMKIVSLGFDLDGIAETTSALSDDGIKHKNRIGFYASGLPRFIAYLGYMFCPTNCVLGPWTSYSEYLRVAQNNKTVDTKTMLWSIVNFLGASFFALSSNCLVPTLVSDQSGTWLVAYRDALSFRCSHYFISFLSQATMVMGGFANHPKNPNYSPIVGYQVVKPFNIELPRSLSEVVTAWNIPMHDWLKQYVFRTARHHSVPFAIFVTYLVSSMLHGMNLQLAAVLFSLGVLSLVEHNIRATIADALTACVRSNRCRSSCEHNSKRFSPISILINAIFFGFVIVHLTFLGTVFNLSTNTSNEESDFSLKAAVDKWSELNFVSYWICFACFVCDILLKL